MKTTLVVIALVMIAGAAAYGPEMRDIIRYGTYDDLQEYRETYPGVAPWIDDADEFNAMQERMNTYETNTWNNRWQRGYGCPMWW